MDIATADAIVQARLDAAITEAGSLRETASRYAGDAISSSHGYIGFKTPNDIQKPAVLLPEPPSKNLADFFDATVKNVFADLSQNQPGYIDDLWKKYFPKISETLSADLDNWLITTIENGGIGIPLDVEAAIVQRGRDRELEIASIIQDAAVHEFAARGYDLPSGALASRFQQASLEAQKKISELNRETTIERYKERVETTKFAIEQGMQARKHAYEVIFMMMDKYYHMYDLAIETAKAEMQGYEAMWAAINEYYKAYTTIEGFLVDIDKYNKEKSYKFQELDFRRWEVSLKSQTSAAVSVADLFARSSAAYLSAQNTIVQLASTEAYTSA